MYRLIIVEDEGAVASALRALVQQHARANDLAVERVRSAADLDECLATEGSADIVLMDIMLGEGQPNGIEVVRQRFPEGCGTQVIYVTGRMEYCTSVYETEHMYFLTKPVDEGDFKRALDKALRTLDARRQTALPIKAGKAVTPVLPGDIEYMESDRRKVRIHTKDGVLEAYATLSSMMDKVPSMFLQCHKSFVVNMDYVVEMRRDDMLLRSGAVVPISMARRKETRNRFNEYLRSW